MVEKSPPLYIMHILTLSREYLDNFLVEPGPSTDPNSVPGVECIRNLETSKILLATIQIYKGKTKRYQGHVCPSTTIMSRPTAKRI